MSQPTCIIQARLGSTRLPGKVLEPIVGISILRRVVERVLLAKEIEQIVVAIPQWPSDDRLAGYVRRAGWNLYRGPEEDVLSRYVGAAYEFDGDPIVRVTADEPFIDPGVLNQLVRLHRENPDALVTNNIEVTWPKGLDAEVFSRELLQRADREDKGPRRQHVTEWMREAPDVQRINLRAPEGLPDWFAGCRWTVDYQRDLDFARAVISALNGRIEFSTAEVVELLERKPGLLEMTKEAA